MGGEKKRRGRPKKIKPTVLLEDVPDQSEKVIIQAKYDEFMKTNEEI